jgi:hypothetical protein
VPGGREQVGTGVAGGMGGVYGEGGPAPGVTISTPRRSNDSAVVLVGEQGPSSLAVEAGTGNDAVKR